MSLLDTASLIVTPNAYKEGKLYSVIPSDGSGDMSVTRATTATRVNSAGLVELVPYNLLQRSEEFENASWGKIRSSITANTTIAPNGTLTADSLFDSIDSNIHYISQTITAISGAATISIYAKANQLSQIQIAAVGGTTWMGRGFDLSNGTTFSESIGGVSSNDLGQSIEDIGNGWYRCTMSWTATAQTSVWILTSSAGAATYVGTGTNSVYIWGAQVVEGSTALPYQKTETRLNIPRLDYSNGTCPSILVEPQRTNLLTYSSSFDDSSWVKFNSTISANNTTSPSGIQDADKVTENTSNGAFGFYKFVPSAAGANVATTISCYVKYNGRNVRLTNSYLTNASNFDLQNGTIISNIGSGVGSIESVGNGWYRCILKTTTDGSGNVGLTLSLLDSSNNTSYTGNGTSGVYIWGAQLELGSYPTSYIPTTSASVTRNADVISKTGISSLIGQTEGTMFVDYLFNENTPNFTSNDNILLGLNDGTTNNLILIIHYGSSASAFGKKIRFFVRTSGATQALIESAAQTSGRYKVAVTYASNSFKLFVNGVLIGQDTSGTVPATSAAYLYDFIANLGTLQNYINGAAIWKTALTNDELAQLTTI